MSLYDFKYYNRKNTSSVKWDLLKTLFGADDVMAMWVADMDFKSPPAVIDAISEVTQRGYFGYSYLTTECRIEIVKWFSRRHQWNFDQKSIHFSPGIIPALALLIKTFSQEGDNICIQQPVYYPFMEVIRSNDRRVLNNGLLYDDLSYEIDFEDLEKCLSHDKTSIMIFCNPHNPIGKAWSKEDVERISQLCYDNSVLLISDEIHCDLMISEKKHFSAGRLEEKLLKNTVVCTAPSKSFNLAGLQTAFCIIEDERLGKQFDSALLKTGIHGPNVFGTAATIGSYKYSEEWLDELLDYLKGNLKLVQSFVSNHPNHVRLNSIDATYLLWLDFTQCNLNDKDLQNFLVYKAKLALNPGEKFGSGGSGFGRMNIACPKEMLSQALEQLSSALDSLP